MENKNLPPANEFQNELYINAGVVKSSLYDFKMSVGRTFLNENNEPKILVMGNIVMSPETAKNLLLELKKEVDAYELVYGQIKTFEEIVKNKKETLKN